MKKLSNELEKLNNQINGVCLYKHLRSNKKMNIKQKREREKLRNIATILRKQFLISIDTNYGQLRSHNYVKV